MKCWFFFVVKGKNKKNGLEDKSDLLKTDLENLNC